MHMLICAIVYAKDEKGAFEKATEIFDKFVGTDENPGMFDYYTTFDDKTSQVSGPVRWGNLPAVARAGSPEGKKLIDEGMNVTWDEFKRNMEKVRKAVELFTDEELFEERVDKEKEVAIELGGGWEEGRFILGMARHYMYRAGQYGGPSVFLYDNDGEGIRSRRHLANVLNKWSSKEYKKLDVFVVPADVHY